MTADTGDIRHDEGDGRGEFYIERDGRRVGELTYTMADGAAVVGHTWVDPQHRGGRLAASLVHAAVQWARAAGHPVIPLCSYARTVFARTPDYADVWKR